jgi:putative transcriptional regulator
MATRYTSRILASIHETAGSHHEAGLMGRRTMRHVDEACLTQVRASTGALIARQGLVAIV